MAFILSILWPSLVLGQNAAGEADFSKSNSVFLVLAEAERGTGLEKHGLEHAFWEKDGRTTVEDVQGVAGRRLKFKEDERAKAYFYFVVHPSFKTEGPMNVKIEVDYFDGFEGEAGVFGLHYDGMKEGLGQFAYKQFLPNVVLKGSGKWLKASFHVKDAMFRESQNGHSDFRLWASPPELCVSRVTITRMKELPVPHLPLTFNDAGEAALKEWNVQWDSGSRPAFASSGTNQTGARWLEVRAPGTMAEGSWRTSVMLEPGFYQFVGKVRTTGMEPNPEDRMTGVSLRLSGMRGGARPVQAAPDWRNLSYTFSLQKADDVELICDFHGSEGAARFDLGSLKLVRKGPPLAGP